MNGQTDHMRHGNRLPIVIVLIAGSFLAILNQTLLSTAIPHIMSDLHLTENTVQWLTTIFMLVNGIMIPITAFLMETFSTRRLFLTSMSIFAFGTFICAISISFPMLMVGRIIQATGAGITMPLMMTILILIFPIERRGSAMGMVGLVIAFAPAIGPALSGWILQYFHWKTLFYVVFPLTIIDIIFAYFFMKDIINRTFPTVDILSIVLSTAGFGGILYSFSSAGNVGWTNTSVIMTFIVGVISLTVFIVRQFKLKQPILEFRVFTNKTFTVTTIIGMITFMGLIVVETILPMYIQLMVGYTALQSGMVILPGALLSGLLSPITGRIFDRVGARKLVIVGLFIITVTTFMYTRLTVHTSLTYLTVAFAVRMIGISMVTMPATTAGINQLPRHLIPHGTAMNNTMRQIGASIGTAVLVTIMTANTLLDGTQADPTGQIHGVNIAFYVTTALSVVGLLLAFKIKEEMPTWKRESAKH